jgi:hypothetical protein
MYIKAEFNGHQSISSKLKLTRSLKTTILRQFEPEHTSNPIQYSTQENSSSKMPNLPLNS